MIIDNDQSSTTVHVNINFTFLRVPCMGFFNFWGNWFRGFLEGIGLDQEDEIGNHILDVSGSLKKIRLTEDEQIINKVFLLVLLKPV